MPYTYDYPRPALTVDALILTGNPESRKILLILRGKEPFMNRWALPGGFVDMEETLEQACRRELQEEAGLILPHLSQFKVFDAPGRDPRHRTISVVFYGSSENPGTIAGGDDASDAAWFPVSELPELAFDHREIITEFLLAVGLSQV